MVLRQFLSKALVAEQFNLGNCGRGHYEKHFCEIILNLNQWFRRRCRFKIFLI